MDNLYKDILNKNKIECRKITIKNNTRIIDSCDNRYVIKKKENNNLDNIYNYLKSRGFDYFPSKIDENERYEVYEFIDEVDEPQSQKMSDIIYLLSLLHSKTSYYKEIDYDYYKEIYERLSNDINHLYRYYDELINNISHDIYMSPSSYLIARNSSLIYKSLDYCYNKLLVWYDMVKDKKKIRNVIIHNNLSLDHFIKADKSYFISWNKARFDNPIYDLLVLYNNHFLEFDFSELLIEYEKSYPLLKDERLLLFIMLLIPREIKIDENEYNNCKNYSLYFDYLYKSYNLISSYKK